MKKPFVALTLALSALVALLAPAAVATAATKKKTPVITRVSPMRVGTAGKITIRGKNFSSRRTRNTVIFRAPDGRTAFAKPTRASSRKLVVKVPFAITRLFKRSGQQSVPTRFKLRVVTGRFGKYTSQRLSPVIVPSGFNSFGPLGGGSGGSPAPGSAGSPACGSGGDWDNDLLANTTEASIGTDPCVKDTDGDGVEDGYEYQSARDLNDDESQDPNTYLPYPGKRPYPNALDPSDGNTDYDGDSLSLSEEQALWRYTIANGAARTLSPLTYSDGEQYSLSTRGGDGRRTPTQPAAGYAKQVDFLNWASSAGYRQVWLQDWNASSSSLYSILDFNRDGSESSGPRAGYSNTETTYYDHDNSGFVSDDERDEDADGLTNFDEAHGRLTPAYWAACYSGEVPFTVHYAGTNLVDADSDGDGVRDGADDQDHDDIPNVLEISRNLASGLSDLKANGKVCEQADGLPTPPATNHAGSYGRVNPFNPCLPITYSRTCTSHPGIEGAPAPFDGSPNWYSLN